MANRGRSVDGFSLERLCPNEAVQKFKVAALADAHLERLELRRPSPASERRLSPGLGHDGSPYQLVVSCQRASHGGAGPLERPGRPPRGFILLRQTRSRTSEMQTAARRQPAAQPGVAGLEVAPGLQADVKGSQPRLGL